MPFGILYAASRKGKNNRKNKTKRAMQQENNQLSPPQSPFDPASDFLEDELANDYEEIRTAPFFDPAWTFNNATHATSQEYDRRRFWSPLPPHQTSYDYEVDAYMNSGGMDHRDRSLPPPPFQPSRGFENDEYGGWLGDDDKVCSSPLPLDFGDHNDARRMKNRDTSRNREEPSLDFGCSELEEWMDNWNGTSNAPTSSCQPSRNKLNQRDRLPISQAMDGEIDALQRHLTRILQLRQEATRPKEDDSYRFEQVARARDKYKPSPFTPASRAPPRYPNNGKVQTREPPQSTTPYNGRANVKPVFSNTRVLLPSSHPTLNVQFGAPPAARSEELARQLYVNLASCNHKVNSSLTLPLWQPAHVKVGSVGYYSRRMGSFVTLFNAFDVFRLPSGLWITSTNLYGKVNVQTKARKSASANFSLRLNPRVKHAFAFAKSTVFSYIDELEGPKEWLDDHADTLLREFAKQHPELRKENLSFVTSTLNAEDYALFVSNFHPDVHLYFDPSPTRVLDRPWGAFNARFLESTGRGGASSRMQFAARVSCVRTMDEEKVRPEDGYTLMLGRIGFKTGVEKPVSM